MLFITFIIVSLSANAFANEGVFTEPAIFERLSHFKDYGVPATQHDPLNQAMIADATCRVFSMFDGFSFYHNPERVKTVIEALAGLPSTASPSNFTLTAHAVMPKACAVAVKDAVNVSSSFNSSWQCNALPLAGLVGGMDAWHRALCAKPSDPAWAGHYDPAYQPQQVALTTGFMCIVACDCAEQALPAENLAGFAASKEAAARANDALCRKLPFRGQGAINFTSAVHSAKGLAVASMPLRDICGCA